MVLEFTADARTPIDTAVVIVHGLDLIVQFSVGHLSRADRPFAPGIVAAG